MEMNEVMFHTQEDRGTILTEPCQCRRRDAWLGTAYYFWGYEEDAIRWGQDSKNGRFQVYSARISLLLLNVYLIQLLGRQDVIYQKAFYVSILTRRLIGKMRSMS